MIATEALQAVQFVTFKGRRFAVLSADDWEALVEWVEEMEDTQIARNAFGRVRRCRWRSPAGRLVGVG